MNELSDGPLAKIRVVAAKAIDLYAKDMLTVESLEQHMLLEWNERRVGDEQPSHSVLTRIALRICSRLLYSAWRSSDDDLRNRAFDNLRRYLERSLLRSRYAAALREYAQALEDVLNQTLEELHLIVTQQSNPGPDDPAAFLKWTQTIMMRQAYALLNKDKHDIYLSLDEHGELFAQQLVDKDDSDPLKQVLLQELQRTLAEAIASMRSLRYRQVLLYTYLAGLDDAEMAQRLQASVQDIYLWRSRALQSLRRKPEVMQILRSLLE